MIRVIVNFRINRASPGTLAAIEDGGTALGPFACLGKADNKTAKKNGNPSRDPEFPYGDTPAGEWLITGVIATPTAGLPERTYGPFGALNLKPVSGQCLTAYRNGRHGIWIHGGDPSPSGGLRPTHGCIRLANEHMRRLVAVARTRLADGHISLTVSVA